MNRLLAKNEQKNRGNLLEQYLNPEKIVKNNSDVLKNYENLKAQKSNEKFVLSKDVKPGSNLSNTIVITNTPYKNIIKNNDYTKPIKDSSDMIVHKVTKTDKEGVKNALDNLKKTIQELNTINKNIYAPEKMHIHQLEYEEKKVLSDIKYEKNEFGDLKSDTVEFYKVIKEKEEDGVKRKDDILKNIRDMQIYSDDTSGLLN